MSKKKTDGLSRRAFIGSTAAATAGAAVAGCGDVDDPGTPLGPEPRVDEPVIRDPGDKVIVRAAIHPGIGIARVGNAVDEFFIGPEVVDPAETDEQRAAAAQKVYQSPYRDSTGAIKRQAARFRVYGYNAKGEVVKELTAENADITWTVKVANRKGQWYRFLAALDIDEAKGQNPENKVMTCPRRNAKETGAAREALAITPAAKSISGVDKQGAAFDDGDFQGTSVSLGELRTDDAGRLLFLSGRGVSHSPEGTSRFDPENLDTFNNADGWFDDICDGPVDAKVVVDGTPIEDVVGAWVAVAPPNYAPEIISWRTMYELMMDVFIDMDPALTPKVTSFQRDILPIFQRLTRLGWVNAGYHQKFGTGEFNPAVKALLEEHLPGTPRLDFERASLLVKMASKGDAEKPLRAALTALFRPHENDELRQRAWPPLYGDAFGSFEGPRTGLALSKLQTLHLARWVAGDFESDFNPEEKRPTSLDDVPVSMQPAMLDHAAMHYCLADAFHPGCELTWPMRHQTMYEAPFRIKRATAAETDLGDELTPTNVMADDGPLHGQHAGGLTRWMAVPWQGDTVFCRSGYDPAFDPHLPSFWPARVPNQVLTEADYRRVMDLPVPPLKFQAFHRRQHWVRSMQGDAPTQIKQMVQDFGYATLGIVERRPGPGGQFPKDIFVEHLPKKPQAEAALAAPDPDSEAARRSSMSEDERAIEDAGFETDEHLASFRDGLKRGR